MCLTIVPKYCAFLSGRYEEIWAHRSDLWGVFQRFLQRQMNSFPLPNWFFFYNLRKATLSQIVHVSSQSTLNHLNLQYSTKLPRFKTLSLCKFDPSRKHWSSHPRRAEFALAFRRRSGASTDLLLNGQLLSQRAASSLFGQRSCVS